MKVSGIENKEKSTVQLTVEFDKQEFEDALNKAYRKNRNSIMIPGFRKGKAPRKIVERMYGEEVFYEDALNIIGPDAFDKAAEEEKLEVVGKPHIEDFSVSDEKALTVVFQTAVYPEVTLGEYKGLGAVKDVKTATEEDITKELEDVQKRNARIVSVERNAKDGDTVVIDFKGFVNGEAFEGGEAEKHSLTLGTGSFVPGFEEQLVGVSSGDELDVNITFPDDYSEELKGKEAVFKVKVHEVKENILPELDDEFAKDVSEFDTLQEYKKSIEDKINTQREETAVNNYKNELLKQAVDNMQVEIPQAMISEQAERMVQEFYYNISSQGMDPEQYLGMMGMNMESFMQTNMAAAEQRVKTSILLRAVSEAENIEASEAELDEQYKKLAESYGMEEEKVRTLATAEEITRDIKLDKAAEIIYASGVEKAPEEENTEEEAKEEKPAKRTRKTKAEKANETKEETEKKPSKASANKKTVKKAEEELNTEDKE